jgi:AAA domain
MLDEQWRMAEPISRVVSDLFYGSQLKVAAPAQHDPQWLAARTTGKTTLLEPANIVLVDLGVRARPAHKFIGYCCLESAEIIAALTIDLRPSCPDQGILILTPYRAQRHEIRKQLQSINAPISLASTVHRAQGSERRIVIFDPACPSSKFVAGAEGMRLMNVALSRAECRLIVLMQADWMENAALRHLAAKFRPVRLDAAKLERLLNQKLPRFEALRPTTAVTPSRVPKPTPKPATLFERFEGDLFIGLSSGPNTVAYRKQFLRDLAGRSAYSRKLTFTEMDAALATVSGRLPSLQKPISKITK